MRPRHAISDADWDRIKDLLPGRPGQHGGLAVDNRRFIDAVRWVAKTGAPWRDLPERLGNWNSQWRRFDRWAARGRWQPILAVLRDEDLEWLILDSTVVRAHACAAGCKKVGRLRRPTGAGTGPQPRRVRDQDPRQFQPPGPPGRAEGDGRSGVGHQAGRGHEPEAVIADKAYDGDDFVASVEARGAEAVIPPLGCRKEARDYDRHLYKERNVAERFWSKVKH
jgi:transposase